MATVEDQVDAHAIARQTLVAQAVASVVRVLAQFTSWYTTADITKMAATIVGEVEAAQRATAAVTDAYLSHVASDMTGRRVAPVGTVSVNDLRAGITHAGAYGRLADNYRWRISEGVEPAVAQAAVIERGKLVAEMDTDLAFRAQANKFMVVRAATAWRRVIRPDLSLHGSCGLCVVAADRVYHTAELLPLHERCKCGVLPIMGGSDPGQRLNAADLKAIYTAAGGTGRAKLRQTRILVHHHGELGPVLTRKGDGWRDPKDVKALTRSHG